MQVSRADVRGVEHLAGEEDALTGGRYKNLTLDLPQEARGRELNAGDLKRYGARSEAYSIHTVVIPSQST